MNWWLGFSVGTGPFFVVGRCLRSSTWSLREWDILVSETWLVFSMLLALVIDWLVRMRLVMCGARALITSFVSCSVAGVTKCETNDMAASDATRLSRMKTTAQIASFAGRGTAGGCTIWRRVVKAFCKSIGQSGVLRRW